MPEPQVIQSLREASRRTVRRLGLLEGEPMGTRCTAAQCHTLLLLQHRGTLTIGDVADLLGLDKSTVSGSVQPLLARDLVRVDPDPQDGRAKPLTLTAEGRRLVATINDTADRTVGRALDTLSVADQATVVRGMALYAQALELAERLADVTLRRIEPGDDPAMGAVIREVMTEFGAVGSGFSIEDPEVDAMSAAYAGPPISMITRPVPAATDFSASER